MGIGQEITVSIRCCTYNQEKYIRQCLEGFIMQKTNFPFEAIVHDDASTDGTADIIREYAERYPDIIKPIYETENQYSKHDGSLRRIMNAACQGKYTAICEGDDYWTDPHKLQKQVEAMESNPSSSLCHTGFSFLYEADKHLVPCDKQETGLTAREKILEILNYNKYRIQTNTVLYKTSTYLHLLSKHPDAFDRRFLMGDSQSWVLLLTTGDAIYLPDITSIYRVNIESACRSKDTLKQLRFNISSHEMRLYMLQKTGMNSEPLFSVLYKRYCHDVVRYMVICPNYLPLYEIHGKYRLIHIIAQFPLIRKYLRTRILSKRP